MGETIFKQPNGLYGRYSYVCDDFTSYNMTEEEYIVKNISKSVEDSKDTLKRCLGDYEEVMEDEKEYQNTLDEGIKETDDEDEKEEIKKEIEERIERVNELVKAMSQEPSEEDRIYHAFFKELYNIIENYYIFYDEEYNKKPYFLLEHLDDIKLFTEKLKELNQYFNKIKEEQLSKTNE